MIEALKAKLGEEVEKLQYELNVTLPNEIRKAVELGDLRENSEYKAALERQQFVQARLGQLRQRLSKLSSIDPTQIPTDRVGLGSKVIVEDQKSRERENYYLGVRRRGRVRGWPRHHGVAHRQIAAREGSRRSRVPQVARGHAAVESRGPENHPRPGQRNAREDGDSGDDGSGARWLRDSDGDRATASRRLGRENTARWTATRRAATGARDGDRGTGTSEVREVRWTRKGTPTDERSLGAATTRRRGRRVTRERSDEKRCVVRACVQ